MAELNPPHYWGLNDIFIRYEMGRLQSNVMGGGVVLKINLKQKKKIPHYSII